MYIVATRTILDHSLLLPRTIPHYAMGGIPFSYPPLSFYLFAPLIALPFNDIQTMRFLVPVSLAVLAYSIYLFVTRYFDNAYIGILATVLAVANPSVLMYALEGAGALRSIDFAILFFALTAAYECFRTSEVPRRRVYVAGVLGGLVFMSHPVATLAYILGVFALYEDTRSPQHLRAAIQIGLLSVLVSSPWWLLSLSRFGLAGVFAPSNTIHGGIQPHLVEFPRIVFANVSTTWVPSKLQAFWGLLAALGVLYLYRRRKLFPAIWLVAFGVIYPQFGILSIILSICAAVAIHAYGTRFTALARDRFGGEAGRYVRVAVILALVVTAAPVAFQFAEPGSNIGSSHRTVSGRYVQAGHWAEQHTPQDATFAVRGRNAEWWPAVANRTITDSIWGTEWLPHQQRQRLMREYSLIDRCPRPACTIKTFENDGRPPDYYVGPVSPSLKRRFDDNRSFQVVYYKQHIMIAKYKPH